MKKTLQMTASLLLSLVLAVSLMPLSGASGDTVTGEDLRASVAERTMDIMDIDWTLQNRVSWQRVENERLTAYQAAGITPATYFEYPRMNFPLKGVMVENNPATLEEFIGTLDLSESQVPGIGHMMANTARMIGMDMNSFLTDISSRVMDKPLTGVKAALTSDALTALYSGANLSAASSVAAIKDPAAVKAAYAKLDKGDLLLAWDEAADATVAPIVHVLVVKDADPAAGTVTVMYCNYAKIVWHFQCDTCGKRESEGPTSLVCPEHTVSGVPKTHMQTDASTSCTGTWNPMYGTTWRTETVSYDQLFGDNGTVPYAGVGYLPYTFKAYTTGLPGADIELDTNVTAESASGGFRGTLTSDYRITSVKAVLTENGGEPKEFYDAPALGSKSYAYDNNELNQVIQKGTVGTAYNLKLYVRSGPLSAADQAQDDYRQIYELDFTKQAAKVSISADKTFVHQGGAFQVSVKAHVDGVTSAEGTLSYKDSLYVPDVEASKAANPGAEFIVEGETITFRTGSINVGAGQSIIKVVFRAARTGDFPVKAVDTGMITCVFVALGMNGGAAAGCSADPSPVQLDAGYNVELRENYLGDNDLLLVYMSTYNMKYSTDKTQLNVTYAGKSMYEITDSGYRADNKPGQGFQRIYGWIGEDLDPDLVSHDDQAQMAETLYSYDVNQSGTVDMNDIQAIANIMKGALPLEGNEVKWFLADIDRNGTIDINDQTTLWNQLMK